MKNSSEDAANAMKNESANPPTALKGESLPAQHENNQKVTPIPANLLTSYALIKKLSKSSQSKLPFKESISQSCPIDTVDEEILRDIQAEFSCDNCSEQTPNSASSNSSSFEFPHVLPPGKSSSTKALPKVCKTVPELPNLPDYLKICNIESEPITPESLKLKSSSYVSPIELTKKSNFARKSSRMTILKKRNSSQFEANKFEQPNTAKRKSTKFSKTHYQKTDEYNSKSKLQVNENFLRSFKCSARRTISSLRRRLSNKSESQGDDSK